jgi:hypothetical protein
MTYDTYIALKVNINYNKVAHSCQYCFVKKFHGNSRFHDVYKDISFYCYFSVLLKVCVITCWNSIKPVQSFRQIQHIPCHI